MHGENASLFGSVEIEEFPDARLNRADRGAHLMEPSAPELLDRRDLFCLPNLALKVFPKSGQIEATKHGRARLGEIDLVIDVNAQEIFAKGALFAFFIVAANSFLECEGARKNMRVVCDAKQRSGARGRFDGDGLTGGVQPDLRGRRDANPKLTREFGHRKVVCDDRLDFLVLKLFNLLRTKARGFVGPFLKIALILRTGVELIENLGG